MKKSKPVYKASNDVYKLLFIYVYCIHMLYSEMEVYIALLLNVLTSDRGATLTYHKQSAPSLYFISLVNLLKQD